MSRSNAAIITASVAGLIVAAATMHLSYTRLKQPQSAIDWLALGVSGLTTGIIAWFVVWGHFQKDPAPPTPPHPAPPPDSSSPS